MLSRFGCGWLFVTLWTVACQAPLSMGFSRQEYWSGLSCQPPGHLPDPGMEHVPPLSPILAGEFFTTWDKVYPCCCKWQNSLLSHGWMIFHCVCVIHCVYMCIYMCVFVCVCVCVCVFIFCIHLSTERHSDSSRILVSFLFLDSHSYLVQLRKV